MAKTNFTKVEEALTEGMRKIEVDRLLTIADEKEGKSLKKNEPTVSAIHLQRLKKIESELQFLEKHGKDPYGKLKIEKEEIKKFLSNPSALSSKDWEKVNLIKKLITDYKAELERKPAQSTDDDLVKLQRKKQITKRFNINEKWIPLR